MISIRHFCLILQSLLLFGFQNVQSGNVLILPGEFSHWHNMRVIVEELVERNHSVTVLVSTASTTVKYAKEEGFRFQFISVPIEESDFRAMWDKLIDVWMQYPNSSILETVSRGWTLMDSLSTYPSVFCKSMLNETNLGTLRQSKFDVVLFDPFTPCGDLLADMLDVPFIVVMKLFFGYSLERICGQMPSTPSYTPTQPVHFTDRMNFQERVQNFLQYIFHTLMFFAVMHVQMQNIYTDIKGEPPLMCEPFGKADIWLMRSYWDWDYPRPFPPNFVFIGGHHCKPPKPLPKDMEQFVQSSGDDGIVVFSLGTIIKNITLEKRNTIASALGQIPQKVLWGFIGEKPEYLAPNTKIYDWIPQNDLLGHPKTKAFISHGGSNGIYEAIFHGVPIVGIPLFGDQFENILFMKNKGAAVMLDFFEMDTKDMVEALRSVINDPSYKKNMMRISELHHDQPTKPLDRASFWIEFVMRNKGAKHLRVQAHNLSWFQYYCLDVAVFLLAVVGLFIFIMVKTCCFCMRKCCWRNRRKNKKE